MQERLVGHVESTPHSGYVHGTPIEAMKIAIEKLQFDGFTLTSTREVLEVRAVRKYDHSD
jgi:hypothetical protein